MMRFAVILILVVSAGARVAVADPAEFIDDAKLLYRVAACGGETPVDAALQKTVDHHCKLVMDRIAKFRTLYFDKGRAWFDKVEPANLPTTVVYPFGGGDLLSALVAFPNATEITTISLNKPAIRAGCGRCHPLPSIRAWAHCAPRSAG